MCAAYKYFALTRVNFQSCAGDVLVYRFESGVSIVKPCQNVLATSNFSFYCKLFAGFLTVKLTYPDYTPLAFQSSSSAFDKI